MNTHSKQLITYRNYPLVSWKSFRGTNQTLKIHEVVLRFLEKRKVPLRTLKNRKGTLQILTSIVSVYICKRNHKGMKSMKSTIFKQILTTKVKPITKRRKSDRTTTPHHTPIITYVSSDSSSPSHDPPSSPSSVTQYDNHLPLNNPPNPVPNFPAEPDSNPSYPDSSSLESSDS